MKSLRREAGLIPEEIPVFIRTSAPLLQLIERQPGNQPDTDEKPIKVNGELKLGIHAVNVSAVYNE